MPEKSDCQSASGVWTPVVILYTDVTVESEWNAEQIIGTKFQDVSKSVLNHFLSRSLSAEFWNKVTLLPESNDKLAVFCGLFRYKREKLACRYKDNP